MHQLLQVWMDNNTYLEHLQHRVNNKLKEIKDMGYFVKDIKYTQSSYATRGTVYSAYVEYFIPQS